MIDSESFLGLERLHDLLKGGGSGNQKPKCPLLSGQA